LKSVDAVRQELLEIYGVRANKRYGLSDVSQLQHGLQSAAIAEARGESSAFIAAALLHDIGHMVHDLGENPAAESVDDLHEELGAAWLGAHFGPQVTEPVRLHVPAKRYLCAVDPEYFGKLSQDSVLSLELQGGPMSAQEVARFRREPHFEAAVRLRRIDEAAKDPAMQTPPLEHFMAYVEETLGVQAR
jgi:phosphonate degradation associated HDIG domain protein